MSGSAPANEPISLALERLVERTAAERAGRVADYIPELALADPERCGVALVSMSGQLYQAGDADLDFTIQSVSKPFAYALAISDLGLDEFSRYVGSEPSGEPFNAISLEPGTGRPANPMINAGAIITSSLIQADDPVHRFARIQALLSSFAGRSLAVDERVFESEEATGDRNRALAYLCRNAGSLQGPVEDALRVYFRQCSLLVTTADLAMMMATLANGGTNPRTGESVVSEPIAQLVLSVMTSCGMYDHAGEWLMRVGLPAKSGVSGGIAAASPGQFGIGVYSPRLDAWGNSTRGVAALTDLSSRFDLHMLHNPGVAASPIAGSELTGGVLTVALRGELEFAAAEVVFCHIRELLTGAAIAPRRVVLDLARVTRLHPAAEQLFLGSARWLQAAEIETSVLR